MKTIQNLFIFPVTFLALLSALKLQAQTNQTYLFNLECQSRTPEIQQPLKPVEQATKVKFGKNSFPEIAYLYNRYVLKESGDIINNSVAASEVVCGVPSGFSQLNLEFGLDRNSKVTDKEDIILLEVYRNRQLVEQRYITRSEEKQTWSIDLQNAQSVTLRADCINPDWWNNCPRLSFTDISLN
ncbi:MAG: hypothetical protein KME19_10160 [Microcoleus vaginatus WJT46-NPBG5]|jgi:hypothetical protein|nr:hypothetical protein [Microcoleus vaginatus WJT46-NPBG5]